MTTYIITVRALGRGRYRADFDGRVLIENSRTPFLDAARALLQEDNIADDDVLIMKHADTGTISLRGRVVIAAGLTVIENESGGPRFAPFRPFMRDEVPVPGNPRARRAAFVGEPALDTV